MNEEIKNSYLREREIYLERLAYHLGYTLEEDKKQVEKIQKRLSEIDNILTNYINN